MKDYRRQAYHIRDVLGGNPIPLTDKKSASIKWKHLQSVKITNKEIEQHFINCGGIALGTGTKVSPFLCIDFDLKYQLPNQYFFKAYMETVPQNLKDKLLCNSTASKIGKHLWLKTDHIEKSGYLTRRLNTIEELSDRYAILTSNEQDKDKAMRILLTNPYQVVIETRSRDSYAVLTHERYHRIFGEGINYFSNEETIFLLDNATRLDCGYSAPEIERGSLRELRLKRRFKQDTNPSEMLAIIVNSGSFKAAGYDSNGNRKFLRKGSTSGHTGVVFEDTCMVFVHSNNSIFGDKGLYDPFQVLCVCRGLTEQEGINFLENLYK